MPDTTPVRLRAHHVFCTYLFQGKGYSREFIVNMANIARQVGTSGTEVTITHGKDDICTCCPVTECEASDLVADRSIDPSLLDSRALNMLQLAQGKVYLSQDLRKALRQMAGRNSLEAVCQGCRWLESDCMIVWNEISDRENEET